MKRLLVLSFSLLILISSLFADMALTGEAYPTSVILSWNEVPDSVYYDIYSGSDFIVRIEDHSTSYRVENLRSNQAYSFSVAARDTANTNLDTGFFDVTTDSWDGIYRWVNLTDKDNGGKMKSLTFRISTQVDDVYGQYYEVYIVPDEGEEFRIFPLFDFGDENAGEWHKYKEDTVAGVSYRSNAELFNTSIFKPSKWRVDRIAINSDSVEAYIETSAMGIDLITYTVFAFSFDENGNKILNLGTSSDNGMVDSFLFKNPNPDEGDDFILEKID